MEPRISAISKFSRRDIENIVVPHYPEDIDEFIAARLKYYAHNKDCDINKIALAIKIISKILNILDNGNLQFTNYRQFQIFICYALTIPCGYQTADLLEEHDLQKFSTPELENKFLKFILQRDNLKAIDSNDIKSLFENQSGSPVSFFSNLINKKRETYRVSSKTVGTIVTALAKDIYNKSKTESVKVGNCLFRKIGDKDDMGRILLSSIEKEDGRYDSLKLSSLPFRDRYLCQEHIAKLIIKFKPKEVSLTSPTSIIKALEKLAKVCDPNIIELFGGQEKLINSIKYITASPAILSQAIKDKTPGYYLKDDLAFPGIMALTLSLNEEEKSLFFKNLICDCNLSKLHYSHDNLFYTLLHDARFRSYDSIEEYQEHIIKLMDLLPVEMVALTSYSLLHNKVSEEQEVLDLLAMGFIIAWLGSAPDRLEQISDHLIGYGIDPSIVLTEFYEYLFLPKIRGLLWEPSWTSYIADIRMECFTTLLYSKLNNGRTVKIAQNFPAIPVRALKFIFLKFMETDGEIHEEFKQRCQDKEYALATMRYQQQTAEIFYSLIQTSKNSVPLHWEEKINEIPEESEWENPLYKEDLEGTYEYLTNLDKIV